MKNSGVEWIGEIPEGWEVSRIKNFLSERTGGAWGDEKKNNANDIICLRIADFDYSRFKFNNSTELTIRNYNTDIIEKLLLKKDDILVEKSGGGDKTPVGRAVIFEKSYKALFANFMDRLRVRNNISALFFLYVWTTYYDNKYMLPYVKQTTGIQNLDITSILSGVFFPLPPKSTQQRIATYLDKKCSKIEETIQNQQQVIEKLKAYKQSLITEAVTGKVKIANGKACGEYESYKDSGVEWIGKIPSEWEVKKLKFSSQIMRGLFSHRPRNDPDYYDGVHPFIQTGEVARAVKYITTYSQTLNELGFSVSREFPAGTVLLTIAANVGDVAILDFNACFPDSVIGFYPKENVSKIFMFYVLKSMKEQFMRNAIISTQMNLNINIVKEEFIPLPSLAEQKEIVKFLEKKSDYIDTAIEQKQNLIEKLTEYKKSLIYECVTGKKEI